VPLGAILMILCDTWSMDKQTRRRKDKATEWAVGQPPAKSCNETAAKTHQAAERQRKQETQGRALNGFFSSCTGRQLNGMGIGVAPKRFAFLTFCH
jgi:hypothetical protein